MVSTTVCGAVGLGSSPNNPPNITIFLLMGYPAGGTPTCVRTYAIPGMYIVYKYAHTRRCPYMRGCRKKGCKAPNKALIPFHPDQYIQISQHIKNGPHKGGLFPFYPFWKKNTKWQPSFLKNLFGYGKIYTKKFNKYFRLLEYTSYFP